MSQNSSLLSKIKNDRKKSQSSLATGVQPGASSKLASKRLKAVQRYYKRKYILNSEAFKEKHPDKQFCWLNFNRLKNNGYFSPNGWKPFLNEVEKDSAGQKDQFDPNCSFGVGGNDHLVHRGEMILGWMPKNEYEEIQEAEEFVRGNRDLAQMMMNNPNLAGFTPDFEEVEREILVEKQEQ